MKKILIVLVMTILATALGLYLRPSFTLIGQLDWLNVLTKGYFVGSFQKFFSQSMLDESFTFVMYFTGGGLLLGLITAYFVGGSKKAAGKSKSKK